MKIRKDFVTNSSSSSFIVAFDSEDTMETELTKYNKELLKGNYHRVINDFKRNKISKQTAEERFIEEIRDRIRRDILYERIRSNKGSYEPASEYCSEDNPEFVERVDSVVNEQLQEFRNQTKEKEYFAEVEYEDHCSGDLEHYIMPQLSFTVTRFSHH